MKRVWNCVGDLFEAILKPFEACSKRLLKLLERCLNLSLKGVETCLNLCLKLFWDTVDTGFKQFETYLYIYIYKKSCPSVGAWR